MEIISVEYLIMKELNIFATTIHKICKGALEYARAGGHLLLDIGRGKDKKKEIHWLETLWKCCAS